MDEVGGALISIALTLCAVFVPSAFLSGISGQFFRQFAITIAASTVISCFVSLTLSPALCALLLKPHDGGPCRRKAACRRRLLAAGFDRFNRGFERLSQRLRPADAAAGARVWRWSLVVYVALIGVAGFQFGRAPTGFIPEQDQGYLITVVQLPPGATLARTEAGGEAGDRHHPEDAAASSTSRRSPAWTRRPSPSAPTPERSSPACRRSTITRSRA